MASISRPIPADGTIGGASGGKCSQLLVLPAVPAHGGEAGCFLYLVRDWELVNGCLPVSDSACAAVVFIFLARIDHFLGFVSVFRPHT